MIKKVNDKEQRKYKRYLKYVCICMHACMYVCVYALSLDILKIRRKKQNKFSARKNVQRMAD